jgi:hypothetical protein
VSRANDRQHELLADRALDGLPEEEAHELEALGGADDESYDLAAAAAALAELGRTGDGQALPAALAERVVAMAPGPASRAAPGPATERHRPRRDRGRAMAWAAAAAAAVLAVFGWFRPPRIVERTRVVEVEVPPRVPTPAEARAALLASATDVTTISWTATKDAAARGASGDVVWSESRQLGFLRIRGLLPNDPALAQYQLWIFDGQRDAAHPVDGGVFDVRGADVVIPIHSAIRVFEPKLFAVTVEKPGGVVVSKRERIVLAASL